MLIVQPHKGWESLQWKGCWASLLVSRMWFWSIFRVFISKSLLHLDKLVKLWMDTPVKNVHLDKPEKSQRAKMCIAPQVPRLLLLLVRKFESLSISLEVASVASCSLNSGRLWGIICLLSSKKSNPSSSLLKSHWSSHALYQTLQCTRCHLLSWGVIGNGMIVSLKS